MEVLGAAIPITGGSYVGYAMKFEISAYVSSLNLEN